MARPTKFTIFTLSTLMAVAVGLCLSTAVSAQAPAPPHRITAQVDNSRRATLVGSRSPRALAANDAGPVAADMQLQGITLVLSRTPAQQSALDQLAAAQQNPASPLYHKWITPAQYAAQFGVDDADIATVETWLEQQGFAVNSVSRSRNRISFSGSAAQVTSAFGTSLHTYKAAGESITHFAPSTDLTIPYALAGVVQRVGNLSSFRPHSNLVHTLTPSYTYANQLSWLLPPDVATIYDVNPEYGSGFNGAGQTIAVVGQSAVLPQDLVNFQTALGVPVNPQTLNLIPGTGASQIRSGDEAESDLDLEYASAMAPGANVEFYYVGNSGSYSVIDSIAYVIDNDLAPIISISYGACEPNMGSGVLDSALEQAAVQGQTVVAAAGDNGSLTCMEDPYNSRAVQQAPAVNYPASSPWVVAMGGTQLIAAALTDPVNTTYWQEKTTGDNIQISSALSYIPEIVWNDDNQGTGGGGGTSTFESRPLWQTGVPGIAEGTGRLVPDISLASSEIAPGYFICSSDPEFIQVVGSCSNGFGADNPGQYTIIGGTSVAAPVFAGLVAVLNQAKGYTNGQGLINPTLYALASNPTTYASAFHDITTGGNNCTVTLFCGTGPQNTDYMASVGYDEASGLGSIDFANLVSVWPEATNASAVATTTTLSTSVTSLAFGSSVNLTATVTGGGVGDVTFLEGATTLGVASVDGSGIATINVSTLEGGSNSITAVYGGTSGYSPSTSTPVTVTVTPAATTTTFTESTSSAAYGASVTFTVAVSTSSGPVVGGNLFLYSNGQEVAVGAVNNYGVGTITPPTTPQVALPPGADSITIEYMGWVNYAQSTSTPVTLLVGPAPTTTTLTATPATAPYGSRSLGLSAVVTYNGGMPVYVGTVTFVSGGLSIGTGAVTNGTALLKPSTLPAGSDSITAVFGATSTDQASTSNAVVVNITPANTTTTLSVSSISPAPGASVILTAAVATNGSPATSGLVTFLSNGSAVGTGTVNSDGMATISLSTLPSGADAITASYGGTSNLAGSSSSAITVTVSMSNTTTALAASSTNPTYGSNVTFTATVSSNGNPATSGVVIFADGATTLATVTVNSNGMATLTLASLPVGNNSISASYGGTSNFGASLSNVVGMTVTPAPTTTVLTASSTSPANGSNVTFTATVSSNGSPVTSGVVNFLDGGSPIGTGSVTNGVATISLSTLPSGADSISAGFAGTFSLAASASNQVLVTVAPAAPTVAPTTTTLTASPTSATSGDNVVLTATVSVSGGPATSGVVTFLSNGVSIGAGTVNGNGAAMMSLSTLAVGSDSIVASYGGTSSFEVSTSFPVVVTVAAQVVSAPPATINVPAPAPVSPGGTTASAVSLVARASYSGTMNLTCALTNSPVGAQYVPTCTITPSTITIAANATAASTLTVQTTSTSTAAVARPSGLAPWGLGGASAMAGLLMFCLPTRRRRMMSVLALVLGVCSLGAVGCGSSASAPPTTTTQSTTAGSYTFTVKGTDTANASTTASTMVTVTVQ